MQLLGIYINSADDDIKKTLKEKWYNFYHTSPKNFDINIFKNATIQERIKILKRSIDYLNIQDFAKRFYGYDIKDAKISINAIVGKNGSGKSTLLDIFNRIINNFAAKIHDEFPEYNTQYNINEASGLNAELYYELNEKIYCIAIRKNQVLFINEECNDLFTEIKKNKKTELLNLSTHIFYTITSNYSLYTDYPDWMNTLYHKNDGYFTPIVLVPYRAYGDIENDREKKLAEKRVQTLSILLYKDKKKEFIENYLPFEIKYELKDQNYFKNNEIYLSDNVTRANDYKDIIDEKITLLEKSNRNNEIYCSSYPPKKYIPSNKFSEIKNCVVQYWNNKLKNRRTEIYYYIKLYLIYKTLKSIVNYETVFDKIDYNNLQNSIENIIINYLTDDKKLNYINLKIIMCIRFMNYSFTHLYKKSINDSVKIEDILKKKEIKKLSSYHEIFSYLLPDFFDTHFYYIKKGESECIELNEMSSGEQHLYNSLSYIIYHIQNAQSNDNGDNQEKIPYKYFNIIFDEAELYYHPEYQRCLINNLINILKRSNLIIPGLNITFVTHSPFILSDIPKECILALKKGYVSNELSNTLGANIYDLLTNQFFMNSSIGQSSKLLLEEIIKICADEKAIITNDDYNFYNLFIQKLGDPYLITTLSQMLEEKYNKLDFSKRRKNYYLNKYRSIN